MESLVVNLWYVATGEEWQRQIGCGLFEAY